MPTCCLQLGLPEASERAERHHERSPPKKEGGTESVGGQSALWLSSVTCSKALSALVAEQSAPSPMDCLQVGGWDIYPSHDALLLPKCTRESVDLWGLGGPMGIQFSSLGGGVYNVAVMLAVTWHFRLGCEASRGYFLELPYLDSTLVLWWLDCHFWVAETCLPGRTDNWDSDHLSNLFVLWGNVEEFCYNIWTW